jgi:hypothetical protein
MLLTGLLILVAAIMLGIAIVVVGWQLITVLVKKWFDVNL